MGTSYDLYVVVLERCFKTEANIFPLILTRSIDKPKQDTQKHRASSETITQEMVLFSHTVTSSDPRPPEGIDQPKKQKQTNKQKT